MKFKIAKTFKSRKIEGITWLLMCKMTYETLLTKTLVRGGEISTESTYIYIKILEILSIGNA